MCAVLLCYCLSFLYSGTQYFRTVEPNNNNNNNKKKMYGLCIRMYLIFNENIYEFVATIQRCLLSCDIWSTNFMWACAELLFFLQKICQKCTSVCLTIVYNYRLLRLLMFYVLYYRPSSYLTLTAESPVSYFYTDCGVRISAFCGCGGLWLCPMIVATS